MDGSRISELTRPPEALPVIRRRQPSPLPRSLALVVGAGWPLAIVVATALAPAPADPEAVPNLVDIAVSLAVMLGLLGTVGAAVTRQPKALVWSVGLGAVWVATTITCPLSGHHDVVGWQWFADLASGSGLLLVSIIGAHRMRGR